jgi:hypothetical protein
MGRCTMSSLGAGSISSRVPHRPPSTDCYSNATFHKQLVEALRLLQEQIKLRFQLYGDEAEKSRVSLTPPKLRASHQSEKELNLRDFICDMFASTPSTEGTYTPRPMESVQTQGKSPCTSSSVTDISKALPNKFNIGDKQKRMEDAQYTDIGEQTGNIKQRHSKTSKLSASVHIQAAEGRCESI